MNPAERCFQDTVVKLGLPSETLNALGGVYEPVASWVGRLQRSEARPVIIGVNGAQGSGKSTFCALLAPLLSHVHGLRTVVLSIDDVYHTRATRDALAQSVHPLCGIRGVPGSHDVNLAHHILDALTDGKRSSSVQIPRFDKAADDRKVRDDWDRVDGAVDVILFEGWCVGCTSLPEWSAPINRREQIDDPDGVWVRWSRQKLYSEYLALFDRVDALVMLAVSSMDAVVEGRWLQEERLWEMHSTEHAHGRRRPGLMTREEVESYVELFERYTRHMLATLPGKADVVVTREEGFAQAIQGC